MKILRRSHLKAAAISSAWLLSEKLIILGLTFLAGILVARFLGPNAFGSLNYAMAVVTIAGTFTTLGLGGTVVRELVDEPKSADEIMGTALILRISASLIGLALVILAAVIIKQPDSERLLILLIATSLPFEAVVVLRLWFEANVAAREVAMTGIVAAILGTAMRICGVVLEAPVWFFAAIISAEAVATAIALAIAYSTSGRGLLRIQFSPERARKLLNESWPIILSAAGAVLYLKLDQLMLGQILGMSAVGVYSVASRISEVWYVLPTVLGASIAPRLLQLRKSDQRLYERRLREAFRYTFWMGLAVSAVISLISKPLILVLFGEPYREAATILSIYIWTCPFMFMGVILQKWFLAEHLLIVSFKRHLLGAGINAGLNLLLIPLWGGIGAAIATLISYTVANYLACFASKKTLQVGVWMTEAIVWPLLLPFRRATL